MFTVAFIFHIVYGNILRGAGGQENHTHKKKKHQGKKLLQGWSMVIE